MVGLRSLLPPASTKPSVVRCAPPSVFAGRRKWEVFRQRTGGFAAARLGGECPDPLLQAAVRSASLRFEESLRPDPLFIDPYSSCLISPTVSHQNLDYQCSAASCYYRLTTKFIDDKLLSLLGATDEPWQIVLLTDGMDTRPYRLSWPRSSVIFDISPQSVFNVASQRLKGVGAKVLNNCILIHVPLESAADLQATLWKRGFSGNKPSLWAIQGLPMSTLTNLSDILSLISSSAMKGSILMGELPASLSGTESETKDKSHEWIERLFMSYGFRFNLVRYNDITENVDLDASSVNNSSVLFTAEQLQFSDAQMELWRAHFERIEDEGDEEGFEEL
ncbi:hypothetical protein Cni_G27673 [Canna indica]|uniref:S-adenosyl-L-methionine-dependent methyltransferase n=1 Tax=Canna indica TaxID=4628 RepID=A0AAQ3QN61_9LILI|nr:hypothetical protein Cni_G27673 [Canna indica]